MRLSVHHATHAFSLTIPLWPLQDIRSLQSCLALVNHPGIAPPTCIAHTSAIRVHDLSVVYDPSPVFLPYAVHHTTLVTAISCTNFSVGLFSSMPLCECEKDSEAVLGVWLPAPLPTPRALPDHGALWPLAVGVEKDLGGIDV